MFTARLLAISFLLCSELTLAQVQPGASQATPTAADFTTAQPSLTPLGRWDIGANQLSDSKPTLLVPGWMSEDEQQKLKEKVARWMAQIPFDPNSQTLHYRISPEGWVTAWLNDNTCYFIHSYQVARDKKDSDAVHPVKSTTCLPGGRFHVKSADVRVQSVQP